MDVEEQRIKTDIQRTLASINHITLKIKHEMEGINNLVRENGELENVVINANQTLMKQAQELGINVNHLFESEEENGLLNPVTLETITEKLLSTIQE